MMGEKKAPEYFFKRAPELFFATKKIDIYFLLKTGNVVDIIRNDSDDLLNG